MTSADTKHNLQTNGPNKSKKKLLNVRAKLQSMHTLKYEPEKLDVYVKGPKNNEQAIEKSIQKYNQEKYDPDIDLGSIPLDANDQIINEERLWHYFQKKVEHLEEKVEKQKVNGWKRLLQTILKEVSKKIQSNELHLCQIQSLIKNKYKQTHELYKEIQSIKIEKNLEAKSPVNIKKKKTTMQSNKSQRINVLYQNVKSLNEEIADTQKEQKIFRQEIQKLQIQRKSLLINFIKNGYYMANGISPILEKLCELHFSLSQSDLPDFLDHKSKLFLIREYNEIIKNKALGEGCTLSRNKTISLRQSSRIDISSLTQRQKLKQIYGGTQEYLSSLIRQGTLKKNQLKLPEVKNWRQNSIQKKSIREIDWREMERRRIQSAYGEELSKKVKKILFGIKLETIIN